MNIERLHRQYESGDVDALLPLMREAWRQNRWDIVWEIGEQPSENAYHLILATVLAGGADPTAQRLAKQWARRRKDWRMYPLVRIEMAKTEGVFNDAMVATNPDATWSVVKHDDPRFGFQHATETSVDYVTSIISPLSGRERIYREYVRVLLETFVRDAIEDDTKSYEIGKWEDDTYGGGFVEGGATFYEWDIDELTTSTAYELQRAYNALHREALFDAIANVPGLSERLNQEDPNWVEYDVEEDYGDILDEYGLRVDDYDVDETVEVSANAGYETVDSVVGVGIVVEVSINVRARWVAGPNGHFLQSYAGAWDFVSWRDAFVRLPELLQDTLERAFR